MTEEPRNQHRLDLNPELLWNATGIIQQAVMSTLLLIVYVVVSLIISRSSGAHVGLQKWMSDLQALFSFEHILRNMCYGILIGLAALVLINLLDMLIPVLGRKDIRQWMHRTDYLLPRTRTQKHWALAISISGSIQEEIMFRGFIFLALIPLWSHWLWAALIMSAFFSLLHANVQGFWSTVWIYIISVILCAVLALSGSIYIVVMAHITINLSNLFILPLLFKRQNK